MCVCACVCMCACVVVCFLLFILKPAFIHRIGCFDWQRHRRVNALLVMQLKSVKPQTPALFSDAYFIIAPLSPFLPGVEVLLCMRLIFILLITLLHVYLGVASTVFNVCLSALASVWAYLQPSVIWPTISTSGFSFISVAFLSVALVASKQRFITPKRSRQPEQSDIHRHCTKPFHL